MMAGVRPRLKPGSSESKYRALPLHQSCLVGTSLSGGHNTLIFVVKSDVNCENRGNIFLDREYSEGDSPLGVHIFCPQPSLLLSHISLLTAIVMKVCYTPLLPKVRVKWSGALPCILEALSSNLGAEAAFLADVRIFLNPSSLVQGKGQVKTYVGVEMLTHALVRVGGANSRAG